MYNDNELLYLISENDDEAMELLIDKYKPMIWSKIIRFKIEESKQDDAFQIGLETLYKVIEIYQKEEKSSFNRFFEMILERKFIDLYRIEKRHNAVLYNEDIVNQAIDKYTLEEERKYFYFKNELSDFEKEVFEKIYIEKKKIAVVASELSCNKKRIYDAINRIKRKSA